MIIRFLLIASLIGQLAFSYQCCGITILCECLAWPAECDRTQCAGEQCSSESSSCCATMSACDIACESNSTDSQSDCSESCSIIQECCDSETETPVMEQEESSPLPADQQCTPIDPKAPRSPDGLKSIIDLFHLTPAVLHPVIAVPIQFDQPPANIAWRIKPQFKSNHQRQASLEVWLN